MSNKYLASNTVHQGAQTDGLTQTHFNGHILKGCLVGHIKKKKPKDVTNIQISVLFFIIVIIIFWSCSLWNLSSPTKD